MEWLYFKLVGGHLVNADTGTPYRDGLNKPPRFDDVGEAHDWLIENDIRGTILSGD